MRTLIQNAWIVDGTGVPPYFGVLSISNSGVISYVGTDVLDPSKYDEVIDADGLTLCPGFIDTHSHSDISIFSNPAATEKLAQGVTTEICGNCGMAPFPVTPKNIENLKKNYERYHVDITWHNFSTYAAKIRMLRPGINLVSLVGHNALRAAAMGYENGPVTEFHVQAMKSMLADCLDQGCAGVSLGLLYVPGKFTTTDELTQVLSPLGKTKKPLTAHLRSEGDQLIESIDEFFEIAKTCHIKKCHVSHVKTALKQNWSKIDALESQLSRKDLPFDITADRYPYTEGMTSLSVILPSPWGDMRDAAIQEAMQKIETYVAVHNELEKRDFWDGIRLVSTRCEKYQPYLGMMLPEISYKLKQSCADIVCEILKADAISAQAAFGGMSVDNMERLLALPNVFCGSDESVKPHDFSLGHSHPRGWGSFPKFFNIALEKFPIETVIQKMTASPARVFGLKDRGKLIEGNVADIVMLSPNTFQDHADYKNPHQLATGVRKVWVHGQLAWDSQRPISERFGTMLSIIN